MSNTLRLFVQFFVFLFAFLLSSHSLASDSNSFVGVSADVGVPDGLGVGFVLRPVPWLRANYHFTHNSAAPGYRVGATLDPINFPVAPTLTAEYGASVPGQIVGLDKSPFVWYDYTNLHLGLEFGKRDYFRFYLRGGISFFDAKTKALSAVIDQKEVTLISDPSVRGLFFPTTKFGMVFFF